MEITIKSAKEIKVIPECFKVEENPPAFIFRQPNAKDILYFSLLTGIEGLTKIVNDCFVRFENKIIAKDEKGIEIQYFTYQQFSELGFSQILADVHGDCIMAMNDAIKSLQTEARNTEKK